MNNKITMKIKKEDYEKLLQYSKDNLYKEIEDYIVEIANKSPFPPCGYGFLEPNFFEKDGEYYISWKCWNSCD